MNRFVGQIALTGGWNNSSKLVVMARSPVEGAGVARGTPESYRPAVTDRALVVEAIVVDGALRLAYLVIYMELVLIPLVSWT